MIFEKLGTTGLKVSKIGFGCMSLVETNNNNGNLLRQAVDMGINFFDTADLYNKGKNEMIVGNALKAVRDKVVIATKVGNQWRPDGSGWDWNPTKKYILSAVEESLKRLQTDYIDLYQLHGGTIEDSIEDTIEAFEILKDQGKIRHYGISSIRPNVIREYVERSSIASVMMQYSLLDRRPEETCLPVLKEANIPVLARGTLASGLLVNKEPKDYLGHAAGNVLHAQLAIRAISGQMRKPADTAIQFVLHNPAVTMAVVGIRTKEQLLDAVKAINPPLLSENEFRFLEQSVKPKLYQEHR